MAHNGFCSDEQIIKSALRKYQIHPHFGFTPRMMYLEEFMYYLDEHVLECSADEVVFWSLHNYKRLKSSEKERYKDLASEANSHIFK
ncbi:hypothetical protein M5D96_008077 [Drosophila gunungcola]|uniref:Uncharacterized protein n=1 Tax=Drosophila gunungcola TaxID=103775 RepID=A0A9P9YLV5_9MUSC|nr:hypothetical protein M5D96_008077 [Drosophila gunungcola]